MIRGTFYRAKLYAIHSLARYTQLAPMFQNSSHLDIVCPPESTAESQNSVDLCQRLIQPGKITETRIRDIFLRAKSYATHSLERNTDLAHTYQVPYRSDVV